MPIQAFLNIVIDVDEGNYAVNILKFFIYDQTSQGFK